MYQISRGFIETLCDVALDMSDTGADIAKLQIGPLAVFIVVGKMQEKFDELQDAYTAHVVREQELKMEGESSDKNSDNKLVN